MPAALAMFNLTGRVALVTGSGSGIGLALAEGLRSAGARVVLNGRNRDKLQAAADKLRQLPGPLRTCVWVCSRAGPVQAFRPF